MIKKKNCAYSPFEHAEKYFPNISLGSGGDKTKELYSKRQISVDHLFITLEELQKHGLLLFKQPCKLKRPVFTEEKPSKETYVKIGMIKCLRHRSVCNFLDFKTAHLNHNFEKLIGAWLEN